MSDVNKADDELRSEYESRFWNGAVRGKYANSMTLHLNLDKQQALKLNELSQRLKVPVDQLAHAAINELLAKPDSDFERAVSRLLEKNAELYKRLA